MKTEKFTVRFYHEDNGNCRVYYKDSHLLYCWQNEGRSGWAFYRCSKDGEPSHGVAPPLTTPLPPGEEAIGRELICFLKDQKK